MSSLNFAGSIVAVLGGDVGGDVESVFLERTIFFEVVVDDSLLFLLSQEPKRIIVMNIHTTIVVKFFIKIIFYHTASFRQLCQE